SSDGMSLLLFARFAAVEDPRRHAHKVVFPLELLLLIVFGAALSDMPGWQGAADFARLKEAWLRKLCPWDSPGTPSADTLERVMGRLDAELFAEGFSVWMRDVAARRALPSSGVQQVAVDGKSLRGARTTGASSVPMHLVHTYLVEGRASLLVGLAPAPGGASSEAAVAADLLSLLELTDTVVTGDANLLTGVLADGIVNAGGGYVLALKGNRGPVHATVCETLCVVGGKDVLDEARAESLCDSRTDSGEEAGHGRKEQRRGWAFDVKHFPRVQHYLPHARSVLALVRERSVVTLNGTETSRELHFFVSTREPSDAAAMATFVRAHWEVESGLHQRLDVVLHEDATRIHNGPGAQNLAVVRRAALAVLKADTSFKASLPRRVRQAGHDDTYRTHLLTLVIS
ncbi:MULTISPECIES: ISAs1 family transposase, partial [unclassified Myxococcus]|uniref:ISAs1 family transposase n=1 Tax=unclassified Myxococcus TaxID=2648731 RepID=UPI00193BE6C7